MLNLSNFFNKYVFPALTIVNTISAVILLFTFDNFVATPFHAFMTFFLATWLWIAVFIGWISIYFENVVCKKKDKLP